MNQCDGCQRGLPMVDNGFGGEVHQGNGKYDRIACTADRYEDRYTNHIDTAVAKSLATEHAGMHFQGAYTVCPYKVGTAERQAYDAQWRRMMNLSGERV